MAPKKHTSLDILAARKNYSQEDSSMKRIWLALLATASLCPWTWIPTAHGTEATRPPIEAFGTVPAINELSISPNGQLLAWIDNSGASPAVEVFDLSKNATVIRIAPEGVKLRALYWADDEILLFSVSLTRSVQLGNGAMSEPHEWLRVQALNVSTRKSVMLLQDRKEFSYVTGARVLAVRTATPKKILMASWYFSRANYRGVTGTRMAGGRKDAGWTYNVFEVDTRTGESGLLHGGSPYTTDWVIDTKGAPVARVEWNPEGQRFSVLYRRGQGWTEIFNLTNGERPRVHGVTDDGSALLMFATLGRPRSVLWRLPVDGGAPQLLLEDPQHAIAFPMFDTYTPQVQGVWVEGAEPQIRWFDEPTRKKAEALRKTFGGAVTEIIGRSADSTRVIVEVSTTSKPSTFYLVDYKRGTADIVGEAYPRLATASLGEMQTISYKARDGYEIAAYLTLPANIEAKQLPLIALPHDGPQSRDDRMFDWLAQFLASRGYAVLQPQFRGSTGFGEAHERAGHRQWGGLMQDDVTDGIKAMVERGVADANRICIAGIGYGGYAALAGAAFTPELYACAISVNGISDLPMMVGHMHAASGDESNSVAYWTQHIGSRTDANVIAKSPARAAGGVRAPVLLLHGSSDTVVPPEQARTMLKALQAQGKSVQLVELPGEDHWLSLSDSRIRVLTEMEKFLAEHLRPNGGS
jgi:dipeptidyl aminopeptidase/acylaminoacyl peptidase